MARKLRIQYPGAIYHVINRGNYRQDVFGSAGAAHAFVVTLGEAAALFRWRVHAYVVMRNHYHLALETPEPNLVAGMHWLQSTYATRFNRLRRENGHLFQGRYQAILLENASALLRVVNYIHLNPVRAGVVPVAQVAMFRWSSLAAFSKADRPAWLHSDALLTELDLLATKAGWLAYTDYLMTLAGDPAAQERQAFAQLSKGWAIGSDGWRDTLAKEQTRLAATGDIPATERRELNESVYQQLLDTLLRDLGKTAADLTAAPKGASWKIAAARELRTRVNAPHAWIARTLHMGQPSSVRVYLARKSPSGSTTHTR